MNSVITQPDNIINEVDDKAHPIVIIGNGPVGLHAARLLLETGEPLQIILYGAEQYKPYNRVKLSSVLAGIVNWTGLESDLEDRTDGRLIKRYGYTVKELNPIEKNVLDDHGNVQPYSKLIIATGSSPHIPHLPGINLKGRYTLRNIDDVNNLLARQISSRHTVILGGGLLGLEAARAMQRWHTQVTVIEHASHLLSRQLDEEAGKQLAHSIQEMGIDTIVGDGVREVNGSNKIKSLTLVSGREIPCDTLIVATGIVPNKSLAILSGLPIGRGIKVNDMMQTANSDIYAIGECAEHRGKVHGLVAPGLEQAGVAVHNILGGFANYKGAMTASKLKVLETPVLSVGPVGDEAMSGYGKEHAYRDEEKGIYRKILVHRNRLVGALSLGHWDESSRVQSHATQKQLIFPWQVLRFRLTGNLWPEQEMPGVAEWPAGATVCQCTGVTRGVITHSIEAGAQNVETVSKNTGAGSVCGSCRPLINELLGNSGKPEKHAHAKTLTASAIFGFLLAVLFLIPLQIPYSNSMQTSFQWDLLWRDGLAKQISGFSILGLFALGLVITVRKRIKRFNQAGKFDIWRLIHIGLGVLALAALLVHTGFRTGSGLNLWLMLSFATLVLFGSAYTLLLGQQHQFNPSKAQLLKKRLINWHIYLFWPVPVLLGFHVLKSYWF